MAYNLFSPSSYWILRSHQVNWRFQTSQTQRLHCVEQSHFLVGLVAPVYFSRGPLFSQVRSGVGTSNLPLIPLHHQSIQLCPCPRNHSKEDILNFKYACCHKYTSSIIFQTCDNLEKMEIVVNYTYTSNSLPAHIRPGILYMKFHRIKDTYIFIFFECFRRFIWSSI